MTNVQIIIVLVIITILLGVLMHFEAQLRMDERLSITIEPIPEPEVLLVIETSEKEWQEIGYRIVTSYNPTIEQCDSDPCISASGMNVCQTDKVICASNEFEFGEIIRFDGIECEIQDRTNSRYKHRIDLLMYSKAEAKKWGRKTLLVEKLK